MCIEKLRQLCAAIEPVDEEARTEARRRHDQLAKPQGALGRLEELGARLAAVAGACPPPIPVNPAAVICAGDHGVHAQGVSPWPQAITRLMLENFVKGGASANALAEVYGATVTVVDAGVSGESSPSTRVERAPVQGPTKDLSLEPAMANETCTVSLSFASSVADDLIDKGADVIIPGDMGIANTTSAAALIAAYTGKTAAETTGRGTGIDDQLLKLKTEIVTKALERHGAGRDALTTLASLGGLEHAAITGLILTAASRRVPVIIDGVNCVAAALAAQALQPRSVGYMVAGHRSAEPGATVGLEHLGLEPLLDLDMRLGEGTGALTAYPLLKGAAALLNNVSTLQELGV
ncbi:nicotinate-nucleotide--dimethylbenzimidazole phosphoribosyltransferase [Salininema proteolyticum]|uniref:Nicotinate-nucleotide--dimethylbenzimidazole phosphoribosyltransferase n=1 Tax=Salininema proteolyticum TaxID=1607685 RepID=A0ABV8U6Q2_9ACTN